jgi:hypothetical protein
MKLQKDNQASASGAVFFVAVAIILALIAVWGVFNLNIWAVVIGGIGDVAWFFIFWLLLR